MSYDRVGPINVNIKYKVMPQKWKRSYNRAGSI